MKILVDTVRTFQLLYHSQSQTLDINTDKFIMHIFSNEIN